MIRQSVTAAVLALLAAAPLAAQQSHDPDHTTAGGALPSGWSARKDRATAPDATVAMEGKSIHVTSGAAAIYWMEKQSPSAPFTLSATFAQLKAPTHPEAYGLFFGGNKLEAADQSYFYFLVRGNGQFTLKHRAGAEVHTLTDWSDNAAVHKADAAGRSTNMLKVVAGADSTRLSVNGVQVAALPAGNVQPGHAGIRVNHNLDVRVDDFTVSTGASAKAAAKHGAKKAKKTLARKG